jgi:hypothetical protein
MRNAASHEGGSGSLLLSWGEKRASARRRTRLPVLVRAWICSALGHTTACRARARVCRLPAPRDMASASRAVGGTSVAGRAESVATSDRRRARRRQRPLRRFASAGTGLGRRWEQDAEHAGEQDEAAEVLPGVCRTRPGRAGRRRRGPWRSGVVAARSRPSELLGRHCATASAPSPRDSAPRSK